MGIFCWLFDSSHYHGLEIIITCGVFLLVLIAMIYDPLVDVNFILC